MQLPDSSWNIKMVLVDDDYEMSGVIAYQSRDRADFDEDIAQASKIPGVDTVDELVDTLKAMGWDAIEVNPDSVFVWRDE